MLKTVQNTEAKNSYSNANMLYLYYVIILKINFCTLHTCNYVCKINLPTKTEKYNLVRLPDVLFVRGILFSDSEEKDSIRSSFEKQLSFQKLSFI